MFHKFKIMMRGLFDSAESTWGEFRFRLTENDLYPIMYMNARGDVFVSRRFALVPTTVVKGKKIVWWTHYWIVVQVDRRTMHYAYDCRILEYISDEECLYRVLIGEFIGIN